MGDSIFEFDPGRSWEYENGFYLTSPVSRLAKALAHFELYKSIVGLPGHVVECGVYKGASLIRFATFREILESPYSRRIIGFDAFGKFPQNDGPVTSDAAFIKQFEEEGGPGIPLGDLKRALALKSLANVELVQGDVQATIPAYLDQHPHLKVALLHIDVDVYRPSLTALEHFFPRVVRGGLVVLDDYGTVAGETRAVDEYFASSVVPIEKLPLSHVPAFIRV